MKKDDTQSIALYNSIIIDGTGTAPIQDGVVLIQEGRIVEVGTSKDMDIPKEYKKKDMRGFTVMPGFINTHVHEIYDESKMKAWLRAGITTVRELGPYLHKNYCEVLKKRDSNNENIFNTRIVSASHIITKTDGYGSAFINSPEEAIEITNKYIDLGADLIKFSIEDNCQGRNWDMLTSKEIRAIIDTAHDRKKRVAVHLTWAKNLEYALAANVDEISHMVVDELSAEILKEIANRGVYWIPTLELWSRISKTYNISFDENAINNLRMFYKAGGKIALGTDYAGYTCPFDEGMPITEIRLMQKAEMTPMDIILAATKNAAVVCDLSEQLGTLEKGKVADVLAVKGNPLDNLEVLTKPYLVIHNGKIIFEE